MRDNPKATMKLFRDFLFEKGWASKTICSESQFGQFVSVDMGQTHPRVPPCLCPARTRVTLLDGGLFSSKQKAGKVVSNTGWLRQNSLYCLRASKRVIYASSLRELRE